MSDLRRISYKMCILRLSFIKLSFQSDMLDVLLEVFHIYIFYPTGIQYGQESV